MLRKILNFSIIFWNLQIDALGASAIYASCFRKWMKDRWKNRLIKLWTRKDNPIARHKLFSILVRLQKDWSNWEVRALYIAIWDRKIYLYIMDSWNLQILIRHSSMAFQTAEISKMASIWKIQHRLKLCCLLPNQMKS